MMVGEVDIGLRPYPLPPIIHVNLLEHWVFIVIFMTETGIVLIQDNFIHIIMVGYTFPTQGFLKKLFQGVRKEKTHIKTILIILIQEYHDTVIQECHDTLITTCHHILFQALHQIQFFRVHIALLRLCMNFI